MRVNQPNLVIAAIVGGAAVQLVFQACGSVKGSATPDARADTAASAPIVTDWVAYTPALTSASTGAVVGNAVTKGTWRRVGDTIELRVITFLVGTPTGIGCNDFWKWSLPDGLSIDTNQSLGILGGIGNAYQPGSGNIKLQVRPEGTRISAESDADCNVNASLPFMFGNNGSVALAAAFPIAGWTSTH